MAKTLSEQVAELERERDYLRQRVHEVCDSAARDLNRAESALAQARVEGAREALTRLAEEARLTDLRPHIAQFIRDFRDREYPATGEEPTRGGDDDVRCDCGHRYSQHTHRGTACCLDCCPCTRFRPAPPAVTEPPRVREVKVGRVSFAFQKVRGGVWCDDQDNTSGDLVALLYLHRLTPTAEEYAALLALASRPTASGEG